ncbi:hypothetical protein BLOT_006899 [Blomia tropicalis]|nr:hypothetical protein BLOT_006899 [Blomia tropicalis]
MESIEINSMRAIYQCTSSMPNGFSYLTIQANSNVHLCISLKGKQQLLFNRLQQSSGNVVATVAETFIRSFKKLLNPNRQWGGRYRHRNRRQQEGRGQSTKRTIRLPSGRNTRHHLMHSMHMHTSNTQGNYSAAL